MMTEHDDEPVPGLPGRLPKGERILWQGAPKAMTLARRAYHLDKVLAYAGLILVWLAVLAVYDGATPVGALISLWPTALAFGLGAGLLVLLATLSAKTTLYTITDRRIVMRIGIALSMSINIPFKKVARADVRLAKDGSGDVVLALNGKDRLAYLQLWPHARPWRLARPEPALRALPDAGLAAQTLGQALKAALPAGAASKVETAAPAEAPGLVGIAA